MEKRKQKETCEDMFSLSYDITKDKKNQIIEQLKGKGFRITKQRLMLLDVILGADYSCCKEIYYRASKLDSSIGTATVYRMLNILEEIGAINRKNMYKISVSQELSFDNNFLIRFDDSTEMKLSGTELEKLIEYGLSSNGTYGKKIYKVFSSNLIK
ncbi:Fur family transcriptional regulator, ferric uptake regulator [Acetitomaculum ruminis DSM 5522]|uniref:Fur family transcriptional regulator, ferric uptake regulator n=1 Tax=Acetitomaculum ruminis DSM 5522 TaxID=1120918 RepID=A0A1I0VTZ4_9FIRM|nr:transcriptional repressor [Acetitomaculum ruminis]SFA79879.1 Fur family transcriptional regulator, ferric uptake regulator [Acetitomaculum ruminis DSM 5522]